MAKGYSISIASDTKAFATGVQKGIIEPLEDAADILQDIGSDGGRDLGKLERSMEKAQDETDEVRKAFSDLQKEIRETGRKSRTDFADPVNRSAKDVEDQLDEVTGEAKQNAAEMFSSFDGSFESIADAAQGTLGGLVGNLKGIPAVAVAAAGAAGLGFVTNALIEQQELGEELKQGLSDAYKSAAEEGRSFIDQAAVDAAVLELLFDSGRRTAAIDEAARLGVNSNSYIRALSGDAAALQDVLVGAKSRYEDLAEAAREGGSPIDVRAAQDVQTLIGRLEGIQTQHEENQRAAEQYQDIVAETNQAERDQIDRTRSAEQERWEALGRRADEAAARGPVVIKTELSAPDAETVRRTTQGTFDRRPLKVRAEFVTRDGKVIV